jgi:hypothetical protein
MSTQVKNQRDGDSSWWAFIGMATFVGLVMWWAYRQLKWLILAEGWSTFAEVYAATVGTLFGGLAFAGIIWTIMLQRRELALQRQELRETRKELERTAVAQEKSEAALSAQGAALRAQVEVAQLSARLNAATALLEHHQELLTRINNSIHPDFSHHQKTVAELVSELESIRASLIRTVEASAHIRASASVTATADVVRSKEA